MNIYDAAHNLAKAIKNSNEYKDYIEEHKKVFSNPKTKNMIEDFRKKAMDIQMSQMSGEEIDPSKAEEMKKLEEILMTNPMISDFFSVEMRFGQIMNDVYKILGDSIEIKSE